MGGDEFLASQFEAHRPRLRAVAYRMLGSLSEAEDAVQEAWLRLDRVDSAAVTNLGGWLTTVVGRVCLDMLRRRMSRRETSLDALPDPVVSPVAGPDPAQEALIADSVGLALLVVLESLSPPERLAFVLHDMFAVPFDQIAPIVGRSPDAAKQMASRARHRVQGAPVPDPDRTRQRAVVDAFLAASRTGDFAALVSVLHPDVVLRADQGERGLSVIRGSGTVAGRALTFARFAYETLPVLVNGSAGLVSVADGRPVSLMAFTIADDHIAAIDIIADPARLHGLDLTVL
jgi:RNA polymerase sigma-70 factor (ECF subfamily)